MEPVYSSSYAGTGTTVIAVIALILVILLIIVVLIFFFFPTTQTILDIRGVNFTVINATQTSGTDNMPTNVNNLYLSAVLTGDLTLNLQPSSNNFVGQTIAVKNLSPSSNTFTITLDGMTIVGTDTIDAQDFAWLVFTGNNTFTRLI